MKNKRMTLLLILFSFLACTNQKTKNENCVTYESGFSICQDTIFVDIKGEMTHAFKYHNKFYVLFEQKLLRYGGYGKRWLYIFSNGEIEKIVDCPKELNTVYLDFFAKNDSIILKPYMNKQCYYFDTQNYIWKEIDKTDDLIFEDEKFYVYSLDFGEWGGKTWFKDKKTGIEYLIESKTPLINKIDTTYYLTDSYRILKIENPLELNICADDVTYENIEKTQKYYSWYGEPIGFDMVYANLDTICLFDNTFIMPQEINIVSSFVWQNELLHIYETDTATYIAKIENNSIKPIQKVGEELSFYNWYYSYRCKNLNGNNELLKFRTKDEQLFGLMDIVDNKIYVYYFANKAELKPKSLGTTKADSIFVNRLNLILSDLSNLQLKDVDLSEQKWGTFDITPNHKIGVGDSWNPNRYTIDTCKSYLIQEDSLISNLIIYYTTRANDLVRTVTINWEKTRYSRFDSEELTRETFIAKLKFLETFLNQRLGQPTHIRKETKDKYPSIIWETSNGLTVELLNAINKKTNYNNIRLVIYKSYNKQNASR